MGGANNLLKPGIKFRANYRSRLAMAGELCYLRENSCERIMWRFLHLTDMHLGSAIDGQWNNRFLCSAMPDVMRCLKRDLAKLKPDFLLVTGDISSQQSRDGIFAARDFIDDLQIPYYPLGGNHDFVSEASRDWFMEAFEAHLPNSDSVYSFTHKGLHFCVLDPWWKWDDDTLCPFCQNGAEPDPASSAGRWAIPPHEFAWLEEDLEENAKVPTVLAVHYPAVPIPSRLARPGMRDAGHLENADMLFEVLTRHPQVKAVFSGHLHMNFIQRQDGVIHIVTSAMPEFPIEYRDVQVHPDRMEISTLGLSDAGYATQSLLPGNDWTAGQPVDRMATISLGNILRA
jgi:Icc protein